MFSQIRTILWAQFRSIRNRLPKTSFGSILFAAIAIAWYGVWLFLAYVLAQSLPSLQPARLQPVVARMCLGLLLYWQLFPIATLSAGWSLEWSKLVIYPVKRNTLFAIDLLLRLSAAPETLLILSGMIIGLFRHHAVPPFAPLWLTLYLPINLFLSLAIRDLAERGLRQKRFREWITVLFIGMAVLPSMLATTQIGQKLRPLFIMSAGWQGTPWHAVSQLSTGHFSLVALLALLAVCALAYMVARWQFGSSFAQDYLSSGTTSSRNSRFRASFGALGSILPDPAGALVQKEMQSLFRSPRFRVIFGMACLFGMVIFLPIAFNSSDGHGFLADNFFPLINLYGMVLLGEVLMWNFFGFDARASQLYFVAPIQFGRVIRVKNVIAALFIATQSIFVSSLAALFGVHLSAVQLLAGIMTTMVAALIFIGFGNLTSVSFPRAINPNQAFRSQAGGKTQAWLLLCYLGLALPIGLAFLAQWTFSSTWAMILVLAIDLAVAAVFYEIATQSAIARGWKRREEIVAALSKETSPISS